MSGPNWKRCTQCRVNRPPRMYCKKKSRPDGRESCCKNCRVDSNAAHYVANREKCNASNAAWRAANPEKMKAYRAKCAAANPERHKAVIAAWVVANSEKLKAYRAAYRVANLEQIKANGAAYKAANPEKYRAIGAKRRATKLQRTMVWADKKSIGAIYANCPEGCHVDHYYPLQGKTVSGLHVEENLCYLPGAVNSTKHNRHPDTLPPEILNQIIWPKELTA